MAVRDDCRHYALRSTNPLEKLERCRLEANEHDPFGCPEGCLFFEGRTVSDAGWQIEKRREP